jgi:hypothetical protein
MRWQVLVVRPWQKAIDPVLETLQRAGIDATHELVDTKAALQAAIDRGEWDIVLYDPEASTEVPLELVYQHAPAAAVVTLTSREDAVAELSRIVATRTDLEDP